MKNNNWWDYHIKQYGPYNLVILIVTGLLIFGLSLDHDGWESEVARSTVRVIGAGMIVMLLYLTFWGRWRSTKK